MENSRLHNNLITLKGISLCLNAQIHRSSVCVDLQFVGDMAEVIWIHLGASIDFLPQHAPDTQDVC